jgi:hypothetical protein
MEAKQLDGGELREGNMHCMCAKSCPRLSTSSSHSKYYVLYLYFLILALGGDAVTSVHCPSVAGSRETKSFA